jgi:hypothetical protein
VPMVLGCALLALQRGSPQPLEEVLAALLG